MSTTTYRELLQWQSHLDKVFSTLDTTRNRKKGKPFFVLEHGLDEIELAEVCTLVIEHGRFDLSFEKVELPFVVFATEIGFQYEDAKHDHPEETSDYWPMFDLKIPNWRKKQKNYKFFKYAFSEYLINRYSNIYLPDGAWFETFPYISWPVYQAILSKDARQDLIRLMKRLNQEQDLGSITSPLELGEKLGHEITRRVEQNQSLRLDQFLDQERLLGEIAYSIVKPENDLQVDFLSAYALDRLKQSLPLELLEVVQSIRENISRTVSRRQSSRSNSANSRTSYHGSSTNRLSGEIAISAEKQLGIWNLQMQIPRLRTFESSVPNLRALLHSILTVQGQTQGRVPAKTLLYKSTSVLLDQWPISPMEKLFDIDTFPKSVMNAIRGDWKMFASNDLLFRCEGDQAVLQRHFEIRFNTRYLYMRKESIPYSPTKIFKPVTTSFGSTYFAYEFSISEDNLDEAQPFIQAAQLVFKQSAEIMPIGQLPYIYEKDIYCKYGLDQVADFKVESAASSLLVTVAEEGSDEVKSLLLRRGELLRVVPESPGSYWIRLETVLGDEAVGALWESETISALRVDFLTSEELAEISGLHIVMLSNVAHPTIEQIFSSEAEVSFNGPAGLKVNLQLEALDAEGESYPLLQQVETQIPISFEYVRTQFENLASNIGPEYLEDISSIWWRIEANGMPLFKREFFSSRKKIRWQKSKQSSKFAKLVAQGIDPDSFTVFGSEFENPTVLKTIDSQVCVRKGTELSEIMLLLPNAMTDQWPPLIIQSLENESSSSFRALESPLLSLFENETNFFSNDYQFVHKGMSKEQLGNLLILLQLLREEMKNYSPNFVEVLKNRFVDRLSAQLSIELIGESWIEIETKLASARAHENRNSISELIGLLPDFLDSMKQANPIDFAWINTKGLWTGKEQFKIAQLSSAQRAIVLANKCLAQDKYLPPKPEAFSRFSEKQYRAFDLGLMLTINPLVAGERMLNRPITSSGWDAFWENRRGVSAYCRINHLQNLELGVEWTWN